MSRYAKPMSQILANMQEAKKITKKERDKLENDNQHGELALRLAQSFGTPQEVKKINEILISIKALRFFKSELTYPVIYAFLKKFSLADNE